MDSIQINKINPENRKLDVVFTFNKLEEGESFFIEHDSDPKPLLLTSKEFIGSTFSWTYLDKGPDIWRVEIKKIVDPNITEPLGELVVSDFRKAEVFYKYGIDYCCGGERTLRELCIEKELEEKLILSDLAELDRKTHSDLHDYNNWSLHFLTDYIVNIYHRYIRKKLPELLGISSKVYRVHGDEHPELEEIYQLINTIFIELGEHMEKEEKSIFPYVYVLSEAAENGENVKAIQAKAELEDWHKEMNQEHQEAGDSMKKIRMLTNGFELPEGACTAYQMLYSILEEFELNLFHHVHLENNILFPKMMKLEKNMKFDFLKQNSSK